ncbi:cyclin-dependent kinase 2-interacting protein [Conger conger]|uniref:cyclin-dependent kinase 2-interacting protein n=1 Tax=Conger conger TaxID=82655 RepID=UPI002A5AFB60|nr:cyclin-dependent kinase 2-interacting protein [Conger conger]
MEAKSPGVSASGRKPVVSGSARKLKDNAADWHNLIMKWNRLNDDGSTIANQIVNLKLSKESVKEAVVAGEDDQTPITRHTASASAIGSELEDRCFALTAILEKMAHLVSKMEKLASSTKGVCELQEFQLEHTGVCTPLFHTWAASHFEDVSSLLLRAYREELALKEVIVGELAHTSSADLALVYLSCWLYQPYLEPSTALQLESLLLETGHRVL